MYIANKERYQNKKFKNSGKSGLKLPPVSLGMWHNFGDKSDFSTMQDICFNAFDNGVTHFDLANNYGPLPGAAEKNFGKILAQDLKSYRDELIISTKAGFYMWEGPYGSGGSRKYLISSLDQSLSRLGLDYVDIFYHHCMDKNTPLEESMYALSQIVKSGKALYVGLSNYDGKTMKKASEILDELKCPFVINQNRYNILDRGIEENGLYDACESLGKGLIIFSPLAQGLLTDRYFNGIPQDSRVVKDAFFLKEEHLKPELMEKLRKLNKIAESRGQTLAQMALAWLYNKKAVTSVLVGASKVSQLLDNIKMINNVSFTKEELTNIDKIALEN